MRKWDKYKYTRKDYDYRVYRESLALFEAVKISVISAYENNVIANKKTNPKEFYEHLSSNNEYADKPLTLLDGEESVSDSAQCAEMRNIFFCIRLL